MTRNILSNRRDPVLSNLLHQLLWSVQWQLLSALPRVHLSGPAVLLEANWEFCRVIMRCRLMISNFSNASSRNTTKTIWPKRSILQGWRFSLLIWLLLRVTTPKPLDSKLASISSLICLLRSSRRCRASRRILLLKPINFSMMTMMRKKKLRKIKLAKRKRRAVDYKVTPHLLTGDNKESWML